MSITVKRINVEQLKTLQDEQDNLCLIDVRELDEWQEGYIPGAIHIPKGDITIHITQHAPEKDKPIYLQCRSGGRSMQAGAALLAMGYENVYSVDGGIMDWVALGYAISD